MSTEISLKFSEEYIPWILEGRKIATTRRSRKGDLYDTFVVAGAQFRIFDILRIEFSEICDMWKLEGFTSEDEMRTALLEIYPDLTPDTPMYIHFFKRVIS